MLIIALPNVVESRGRVAIAVRLSIAPYESRWFLYFVHRSILQTVAKNLQRVGLAWL